MAKDQIQPGVSAKLLELFDAARPAGLNDRQWCIRGKVSTSFFTDLKNGREPGIDKVERMAGAIGLSLSDFLVGEPARTRVVPDEPELEAMLSEIVADEVTFQTRPVDLPRIFATALHEQLGHFAAGIERQPMDAENAHGIAVQSRQPTTQSEPVGSRTT